MNEFKAIVLAANAFIGGIVTTLFGTSTISFKCLLVLMVIDFATGIAVSITGKSPKTESGGISSAVGWKGLIKKVVSLLFVAVAQWVGLALGDKGVIREVIIYGFIANEFISIVENGGLLGIKYPEKIKQIIDVLQKKGDFDGKDN